MESPVYNEWPSDVWAYVTSGYNELTKRLIREASDMPRERRLVEAVKLFNAEPNAGSDSDYFRMMAMAYSLPDDALERMVDSFDISSYKASESMKRLLKESPEEAARYIEELRANFDWFKSQKLSPFAPR